MPPSPSWSRRSIIACRAISARAAVRCSMSWSARRSSRYRPSHTSFPGIKLLQELLAEVRISNHAVTIDDDVVRLDFLPWQIVLGDNDTGSPAGRSRSSLEFEVVLRSAPRFRLARYLANFCAFAESTARAPMRAACRAAAVACRRLPNSSLPCDRTPAGSRSRGAWNC